MAITTKASGTQSATLDVEHTLDTDTDPGIYVFMANLTAMVNGDVVILRAKTKVLTGDTAEGIYVATFANDPGAAPIVASPPICSMFSLAVSVEQTDGAAGRSFPWSLLQIDA